MSCQPALNAARYFYIYDGMNAIVKRHMALTTLVTCPKFWADGNPHDKLSYKSWQWLERENRLVAMAIGMAMAESQLILGETGLGIRCGRWIFGLHWVFSLTCWLPWAGIRVKRDSNFVISPAETVWEWLRMYPSTIFHHILENPKKPTKWWISQEFDVASPHSCASAIQPLPLVATHTDF